MEADRFAGLRPIALVAIGALALACSAARADAPRAFPGDRDAILLAKQGVHRAIPCTTDDRGYDVIHYDLTIDVGDSTVAGTVVVGARALTDGLTEVVLDLRDELTVSAVASPTHGIATSTHANHQVTLTLATAVAAGDSFAVSVTYAGQPPAVEDDVEGLPVTFTTHGSEDDGTLAPLIYTISVTNRAHAWWPCKDVLTDKATIDVAVTVAPGLVAVSNGALTGMETLPDERRTYHWSHGHPIATYLVSLAISNYVVLEDTATIQVGENSAEVPLRWYVYPEDQADAEADFSRVDTALEFFSSIFGPYPYWDEKYAMAAVSFGGGMEHQTCTSLGAQFILGNRRYEWIFVHELAHQWFGDAVGLADWRDVWLNEGFATYAEALWVEHQSGAAAYRDYVAGYDPFPPPEGSGFRGTVYDPEPLFGTTPYDKGACILHMLRSLIGDDAFFATLRAYADRSQGLTTVVTDDFRAVAEEMSGQDLTGFFDQWLNYVDRPLYQWQPGYERTADGYDVHVRIAQSQEAPEFYTMPIEIAVVTTAGQSVFVAENDAREQDFTFHVDARPTDIRFDPDGLVLKPEMPAIGTQAALRPPWPNPARGSSVITYVLPGETPVTLRVYDILGRRVRTLIDGRRQALEQACVWDGTDDGQRRVGTGFYFVELKTPGFTETTRLVLLR
jgi:aminopeptidase N